jgi:hypothetical protein
MLCLLCPLEQYDCPSNLTVGALCFVVLLSYVLKFSSKFICLPFVKLCYLVILRELNIIIKSEGRSKSLYGLAATCGP